MQILIGFQIDNQTEVNSERQYVSKLNKYIYGLKKGNYNWYEMLKKSLVDQYFKPFYIDPCLYIVMGMLILTYVDDCIIVGPSTKDVDGFVDSMRSASKHSVFIDDGDINKFFNFMIKDSISLSFF